MKPPVRQTRTIVRRINDHDSIELEIPIDDTLKPAHLMERLENSGNKYTAEDVLMIAETPEGDLRWLEQGNPNAGLVHIYNRHLGDFKKRSVNKADIPFFLHKVLQKTPVETGVNEVGPYAVYISDGKRYLVAHGNNGFVVSFFPLKGNEKK